MTSIKAVLERVFPPSPRCADCNITLGPAEGVTMDGQEFCDRCGRVRVEKVLRNVIATTTHSVDGYRVKRYIDIDSVEIVIGTGPFSEFSAEMADFFGERATSFERKLQDAKKTALKQLKWHAHQAGGNAVVGLDLDYTEFSGNRIGVVANGTIVELEPVS